MRSQLVTYIREKNGIKNTFVIDNMFAFQVAIDIIRNDKVPEQKIVDECQHNWSNGKK